MAEQSAEITKLQADFLSGILTVRAQIERDLQTAVGMALAGGGVDMVQGMQWRFEAEPPRVFYSVPDDEPEKPAA